ncbi:MAG: hypothetical protein OXG24_13580 [Gammaproteobacteria bacterium]|nr:hypothetical protein [Gammaproteobacteria bacterium]
MTTQSNKKTRRSTIVLTCTIAGLIVFVGGLLAFLHKPKSNDPLDAPSADSATHQSSVRDTDLTQSRTVTNPKHIQSLKQLSDIGSDFDRKVALYGFLDGANEQTLMKLIIQSKEISSDSLQDTVQQAIFQRFASISPNKAIGQLDQFPAHRQQSLTTAIFVEWSQSHLDDAIARASKLNKSRKNAALLGILQARSDLSDDLRKGIAKELGNEQFALDLMAKSRIAESGGDPSTTWGILTNDDQQNMAQIATLVETAKAWYDETGFSALLSMQETLGDWTTRQIVLGATIYRMSPDELEQAFHQAVLHDQGGRWSIAHLVTQAWVGTDPERAFAAVSTLDSSELKNRLQETVVRSWASDDPYVVLERIDELPDNVQRLAHEGAIVAIARSDPMEASQLLSDVEDNRTRSSIAWSLTSIWSREDVHEALNWVLTDPTVANMRRELLAEVLYQLAGVDPELALDTALNQPIPENREGLESSVIAHLARTNLQQAIDMLSKVRDGRTKVSAYGNVGNELVRQGDINQALKLAEEFVEPNQTQYYQSIVNVWSRSNPENLLDSLNRLPSTEVQSRAAMTLIASNRWRGNLTDEQLDQAKAFLSEQDARLVERGRVQVRRGNVIWPRNRGTSTARPTPRSTR